MVELSLETFITSKVWRPILRTHCGALVPLSQEACGFGVHSSFELRLFQTLLSPDIRARDYHILTNSLTVSAGPQGRIP